MHIYSVYFKYFLYFDLMWVPYNTNNGHYGSMDSAFQNCALIISNNIETIVFENTVFL